MSACAFCDLATERILKRGEVCLAFGDGYPISPGHTLVIPKRHISSFFGTTAEERSELFSMLDWCREELIARYNPAGFNIGINDGQPAGQTVMHLHIHLIPRYLGDKPDPRGGVRWIFPAKADYWSGK